MKTAIIVHGGAGAWNKKEEKLPEAIAACEDAAAAGQRILLAGDSAMDAVEAAVRILEDCPVLDAGRGSYLNAVGAVEMDAIIMDGRTLEIGAVGAVQRIRNPVTLARRVLSDSPHNFLVAHGVERFTETIDYPRCEIADLLVGKELEKYEALPDNWDHDGGGDVAGLGTVGAVALDADGNLAVATSTGGTPKKQPGRIGDSPLVGSGAYADNRTAAAGATGHGEALMRVVISKQVCDFVADGLPAQQACAAAIVMLAERVQGEGGVIAIDARGQIGAAYNTDAMPHAYARGEELVKSSL